MRGDAGHQNARHEAKVIVRGLYEYMWSPDEGRLLTEKFDAKAKRYNIYLFRRRGNFKIPQVVVDNVDLKVFRVSFRGPQL